MTPTAPPADRTATPAPRPRHAADLPRLAALLAEVHERDGYPMRWPAHPAEFLTPPGLLAAWVVATAEEPAGEPVGHVALSAPAPPAAAPWTAALGLPAERLAVVGRLFVAPGARRAGAGRRLLDVAVARAAAEGRLAVLDVLTSHEAAHRMYLRAGWREVGRHQFDWAPPGVAAVLMAAGATMPA